MLHIDGAIGEGGGQVLRTALGLSMVTGQPFRITNIRANRNKPGLMRQHLTGVTAAAALCGATIDGATVGSTTVTFHPGAIVAGDYHFAVGTAGSVGLVLQAILPGLLVAPGPSRVRIDGGTHVPHAPPVGFVTDTLLPLVRTTGVGVTMRLDRHGFYPAGGGRVVVDVTPSAATLRPVVIDTRGDVRRTTATAVVAGLPESVARRELAVVAAELGWADGTAVVLPDPAGNAVLLSVVAEHVTETFTAIGSRGVRAEAVAAAAVAEARRYLEIGAPVGPYLADQLLVFLAMAGGGSFVTGPLSLHATTNMDVIRRFVPVRFDIAPTTGEQVRVTTVAE